MFPGASYVYPGLAGELRGQYECVNNDNRDDDDEALKIKMVYNTCIHTNIMLLNMHVYLVKSEQQINV